MTRDFFAGLDRRQRRQILADEAKRRKTGRWPAWEKLAINGAPGATGWAKQFHTAYRNQVFAVLERDAGNGIRHLMVTTASGIRPTWHEMQRIKDEIAGVLTTAVEVYPPKAEIVDGADAYHIWVVQPLPFGIYTR